VFLVIRHFLDVYHNDSPSQLIEMSHINAFYEIGIKRARQLPKVASLLSDKLRPSAYKVLSYELTKQPLQGSCMETHVRSIAKAVSWRIVATLTTMLLVFIFTGNLVVSGGVGLAEVVSKTAIYYLHERAWNAISFGRTPKAK
jgi:uncharacterized membrane protein